MTDAVKIRGTYCVLSEPDILGQRHAQWQSPMGVLRIDYWENAPRQQRRGGKHYRVTVMLLNGGYVPEFLEGDGNVAIARAEEYAENLLLELKGLIFG